MNKHKPYVIHAYDQVSIIQEMNRIGSDPGGIALMAPKGETLLIRVSNVSLKAANILKQEMLARGGDAAVHMKVSMLAIDDSDVLLIGTRRQLRDVLRKLKGQPFGLKRLGQEVEEILYNHNALGKRTQLSCKEYTLPIGQRTLVMGILNATPDSFSDGGLYNDVDRAVQHAEELVAAGADILDIGGESTRPGHVAVDAEEELRRVIPVIQAVSRVCKVPISIDTYKAEVAKQAIKAGAHIINDVWGAKRDPDMARVAAELGVPIILMHNREDREYQDFFRDFIHDLYESIDLALEAGVKPEQIILDPGIGFAKSLDQNLETMRRLDDLVALGYPVLLGTSRKSMIGKVLDLPVEERMEGTAATCALGVAKGCHIVRVHDVREMKRTVQMMDAMLRGGIERG